MTIKVILNPYSNRWNAQKRWGEAEIALRDAGVKFDLSVSERPDHIVDLAAAAVSKGFSTIVGCRTQSKRWNYWGWTQ